MINFNELDDFEKHGADENVLLLCCGDIREVKAIPKCSVILIEDDVVQTDVFNTLQEVFNIFDKWDEDLKRVYYEGGSFVDLVNCCDPVIYDPISISDAIFRHVAFSRLSEERGLTAAIDHDNMLSVDVVNSIVADHRFSSLDKLKGINKITPIGNIEGDLLFQNIFDRDVFVGRVMMKLSIDKNEYRLRYNKTILKCLYKYSIMLYNKYSSFNKNEIYLNGLRSILQSGLDGNIIDTEQWQKALLENNWDKNDSFQLIQIRPNLRYDKQMYAGYFSAEIESRWQGCVCFEHQGKFMLLINCQRFLEPHKMEYKQALAYFLRESLLIAGLSRIFNDIEYLNAAYKQTEIALDFGALNAPTLWYYKFDDYVLSYILAKGMGAFEPAQICSEKLLALKNYDLKSNTEYCRTLFVYIQCKFNSTEAARKLIIQRSSFNYRLERIKEISNIDLDSNDDILYLALSFKLLKIEN
jgi:Regulator of polyketide synthase expression